MERLSQERRLKAFGMLITWNIERLKYSDIEGRGQLYSGRCTGFKVRSGGAWRSIIWREEAGRYYVDIDHSA